MGRSKFPGKPPKTVTRKRIKVLGRPEATQTDPVTVVAAAENIYYGLSLFKQTFGDNEKEHPPFHGFSSKEAKLSVCYIKTQQRDTEIPTDPAEVAENSSKNKDPSTYDVKKDIKDSQASGDSLRHGSIQKNDSDGGKNCKTNLGKPVLDEGRRVCRVKNRRTKLIVTESLNESKTPVLKPVNNILERHQRTRQLRNSTAKRLLQRAKSGGSVNTRNSTGSTVEKIGTVRKFVLPVRSVHSSRVIKPNKRFIEELEETCIPESSDSLNEKQHKKAKILSDKTSSSEAKVSGEVSCTVPSKTVEKEMKKSKKNVQNATNNPNGLNHSVTGREKSLHSTSNAQTTKTISNESKKSQVLMNKNKASGKIAHANSIPVQDPLLQVTKSNNSMNNKQVSIPVKVLPDSNAIKLESSRVQTRSGSLSAAVTSPSTKTDPQIFDSSDDNLQALENSSLPKASAKETAESGSDKSISSVNSQSFDTESTISETGSEHSDNSEDEQSEWTGMKLNGGKVILRKARLKLDNRTSGGAEGPFSNANVHSNSNGSSNPGLAGTVKCGVCGAVRFYRFVKQARKFGIHSCESCRKFISKMIKRQACAKSTSSTLPVLQCHKGDGLCLVPPVVRSQQWNLMRCVYKARCPACWLKMCLKCYNIPAALRAGLNLLLPALMRDPLVKSTSVPMSVCQDDIEGQLQRLTGCKMSWPAEEGMERSLFKSATSWNGLDMLGHKTSHQNHVPGALGTLEKFDYPISVSPGKKRRKDNRIKVRKKVKNPSLEASTTDQFSQPVRQRLELKGPRVKHVCRSASVALGQPIATFPSIDGKEDTAEPEKNIPRPPKDDEKVESVQKVEDFSKDKDAPNIQQDEASNTTSNNNVQQTSQKRGKLHGQQNFSNTHAPVIRSLPKPVVDEIHTVSIDFWEQYDPAEVGAKGFALIGSESFHIPAICYLCGSAGKDPLIHCQCCCEPYHAFCLEPSEWNACAQPNWCCPRCTICQTCRLRSGPKLSCIRCRQSFHHSCLSKSGVSARLYSPDRPYVCQSCIKCKSCGSEGVSVHVGNLPLCSMCFKLRQRGNYCPLCQRCYDENDFDTKMMECNECSCWVHARCEGLSDERYEILSYLPDSIEFNCRQCAPDPNSIWRNAVETELKAGFIGVIKSLSKNRKACAALKWSPRKECLCRPISSVRKLDFSDEKLEICVINGKEVVNRFEEYDDSNSERSTDADSSENINSKSDGLSKSDPESDIHPPDVPKRGLRRLRQKFHLKDCSVRVKNCLSKDCPEASEGKEHNAETEMLRGSMTENKECLCLEQQIIARPSPTLMSVKRKVNGNEYGSLLQFHCDMEHVINRASNQDLIEAYHKILREVFPWFDPKHSRITSSTGGLSTPTKESYCKDADNSLAKLDDSILETWKEEVLRAPKAIAAKSGNLYHSINIQDSRSCCLCKGLGDGPSTREGRLLYCGQNEWVHANCALWSNEVFEEIDGSLQNVHSAISRGRLIRCTECGKKGASVGCCSKNCNGTYHYPCARNIELAFNDDKTVFCTLHLSNCLGKTPQSQDDFDLKRPVYVELDRKKKKYAEPNKVKVMIGSLTIDCLGTVVPEFSDSVEKIVPSDYKCSRLYWSTVNPLKVVRYYVRTFVQVYVPEAPVDTENNVTIDHSKEQEREREREKLDIMKLECMAIKQTIETLVESVCNKEADENLAEQNNTDLLPPELKEAIFEDLPHDLLDGISMQDIFPKMTYEDFLAMDMKTDGGFGTDLLKDDILPTEVDEMIKPAETRVSKMDPSMPELGTASDFWLHLEAKSYMQDSVDDLLSSKNQKFGGRELKRSKSEVLSNNSVVMGGPRHHQKSCSLTWSYKLDGTYGPTMMRRKLPKNSNSGRSESAVTVMDAPTERTPILHELRIPESIMVTVGRASTPTIISESVRELKYCIDDSAVAGRRASPREEGKEHKRLLWHARQHPRILQVDGSVDTSSASECSSPEYAVEERVPSLHVLDPLQIPQVDGANDDSSCELDCNTDFHKYASRFSKLNRISKRDENNVKDLALHREELVNQNDTVPFKIPQLDGADDISSDDECLSPGLQAADDLGMNLITKYLPIADPVDQPVTCKRCQCTYRTQDSYNRHLVTCDIMTTSDSDSETMDNKLASPDSRFSPSMGSSIGSPQFITMSPSEGHTLSSEYPDIQATSPIEASIPSPHPGIQIEPIAQAIMTPQIHTHATVETVHQTVLTSNDMIVQTQYTRTTTTLPNTTVLPQQQQETTVQITEITDPPIISNESTNSITQSAINVLPISPDSTSSQTIPSPQISPTFLSTGVQTNTNGAGLAPGIHQTKINKPRSPRTPKPRAKGIKPNFLRAANLPQSGHVRFQTVQNTAPIIQLQQAQRATGPTVILQQVPQQNLMSAYAEALQQQSGQNLQYVATIGGQHETSFKPQYIAANPLVPGTYIQASSDNLLTLQNGGISVLPSVQIAQPQPTVLGTIIQQQPGAIQCGVISSEQLVLSSAPALEMFTDSTGSMFVSSQPMYYGLETIVSNTVMSSSQFVAGAVPQVLASSYQTTTQVFQASKLMEPIVDVQTVTNVPTVPSVQTVQGVPGVPGGYVVVNQPAPQIAEPTNPQITIPGTPEQASFASSNSPAPCIQITEPVRPIQVPQVQPIVSRSVSPREMTSPCKPPHHQQQQPPATIPRVAVRPSPMSHASGQPLQNLQSMQPPHQGPWRITEPLFASEQPISNSVRPYFDSKHVSENTSMIKSSISSKMPPLSSHCIPQRNNNIIVNKVNHNDVNNVHNNYVNPISNDSGSNCNINNSSNCSSNSNNINSGNTSNLNPVNNMNVCAANKITMPVSNVPTSRPMNRVLPMQAITSRPEPEKCVEKPDQVTEEPTKPVENSIDRDSGIVEPIKKPVDVTNDFEVNTAGDMIKLDIETMDVVKESLKMELEKDTLQNKSLKIVFQKQLQDGSYKITQNMKNVSQTKKTPQITSVEVLSPRDAAKLTSLQLSPLKTFALKSSKIDGKPKSFDVKMTLPKPRAPPIAVKKPRIVSKILKCQKNNPPKLTVKKSMSKRPSMMYEIKSQDGFTHTASSMSEVWDKVFEAVQTARRAHNLPPLPHNPLTENLGLENNATVYLVEQLPGVNRCIKYKPRLHNLTPPKPGELENDLLAECESGAARAESFKGRKVHDMFSWLASRHRQQPKMIAITENESRRAASTNLPMAMRFRNLKETSKQSVGVYHSHIHGRGLFCLRDIESGEMVIEYAGEVIRASLTDKREKYYDSKNIGCYMFKIDDHLVVDATMKGNAARFINHSCEPNCYSRVVDILGKKHILIFALRRIMQGEELTYDYKFPFEDIKIPCTCGSRRCRKYLN